MSLAVVRWETHLLAWYERLPLPAIYNLDSLILSWQYNFTGNLDFVKFFQKVQEAGLHGILRIGPYACAEWNYGYQVLFFLLKLSIVELTQQDLPNYLSFLNFIRGFPVWLHNIPDIKFRTDNEIFKVWAGQMFFIFLSNEPIHCWPIYSGYTVTRSNLNLTSFFFGQNEMQTFTTKIVNMAKEAKLFASQGGPIILAQVCRLPAIFFNPQFSSS